MSIHATPRQQLGLTVLALGFAISVLAQSNRHPADVLPQPFATPSAMKFPKDIGWPERLTPKAPAGFVVDALATNIESPRWLYVLSNGDVLVSQSRTRELSKVDAKTQAALKQAGSLGRSPDQIMLLRDGDKDGKFETRRVFLSGLNQPFGMALSHGYLYIANTDSVVRIRYKEGADHVDSMPEKVVSLPAGGYNNHWTRNLLFSANGDKLYITVGSQTNVDEEGLER